MISVGVEKFGRYTGDINPLFERSTKVSPSYDERGCVCFSMKGLLRHKREHRKPLYLLIKYPACTAFLIKCVNLPRESLDIIKVNIQIFKLLLDESPVFKPVEWLTSYLLVL